MGISDNMAGGMAARIAGAGAGVEPVGATQEEVLRYLSGCPAGITFVHGKAGCGKSHLIKKLEAAIPGCQVLTPTNLAASLYRRARTLHSFFWSGLDDLDEGYQNPENITPARASNVSLVLSGVTMLVFDEISMVRSDMFEMINQLCQKAKGDSRPFGGVPVVVVGDMFQLPPVVEDEAIHNYLIREYGGIYFYDSHVMRGNLDKVRLFELTKSYRQQNDPEFVRLLDAFRRRLTPEEKVALLEKVNARVSEELPDKAVYIASTNEEVSAINARKLAALSGELQTQEARYRIRLKDGSAYTELNHGELPCDKEIEPIVVPSQYEGVLKFKIGARVMLTKNSKFRRRRYYTNGDFGTVEAFNGAYFTIRLDNGCTVKCPNPDDCYSGSQMVVKRYEFVYDEKLHKVICTKKAVQTTVQFPIKSGYAFTIHKSQGQTYDKVILDLSSHIFAPGQLYVALSRARSLGGLYLTRKIAYSDLISDESVFRFLDRIRLANGDACCGAAVAEEAAAAYGAPGVCGAVAAECVGGAGQGRGVVSGSLADNPRCDDFISFVRMNERNESAREFLCRTLGCYKSVFALGENELAMEELVKVLDLVNGTYVTDGYAEMIAAMRSRGSTEADCRYNLNAVFEIYTDVVKLPRRQVSSDARYLPCEYAEAL